MAVVVLDYIRESGEAAIVVKAALAVREKTAERCGAIALFTGTAFSLEIIHSDFLRRVQVPSWFCK